GTEGLVEPVHGIGAEQQAALSVEAVHGAVQRRGALLDQVAAAGGGVGVALHVDQHEVQVALDQLGAQRVPFGPAPADLGEGGAVDLRAARKAGGQAARAAVQVLEIELGRLERQLQ